MHSRQQFAGIFPACAGRSLATPVVDVAGVRSRSSGSSRPVVVADRRQRVLLRRRASKPVTRVASYDEDVEECRVLDDPTRPALPKCNTIMDWRSAHRGIAITNGTEIRLSDNLSVGRLASRP